MLSPFYVLCYIDIAHSPVRMSGLPERMFSFCGWTLENSNWLALTAGDPSNMVLSSLALEGTCVSHCLLLKQHPSHYTITAHIAFIAIGKCGDTMLITAQVWGIGLPYVVHTNWHLRRFWFTPDISTGLYLLVKTLSISGQNVWVIENLFIYECHTVCRKPGNRFLRNWLYVLFRIIW